MGGVRLPAVGIDCKLAPVTGLRGRASIAGAALILLVGLAVAIATALPGPPATTSIQGIDVSSHEHPRNAVIDWPEVAAAGYSFTAIKASESTYYLNPYYASDAVQAARAGLFVMPYAFANPFRAKGSGSAHDQADAAARVVGSVAVPAGQMLPLALDIEPDPYAAGQKTNECYGLSRTAMVAWIRRFLAEAQLKTGKKPVIYTLAAWWKACTGNSAAFGGYPLWIASYGKSDPALPGGWRTYTFWQHTARGAIPGITGSATDEDYLGPVWHAGRVARPLVLARLQALTSGR